MIEAQKESEEVCECVCS